MLYVVNVSNFMFLISPDFVMQNTFRVISSAERAAAYFGLGPIETVVIEYKNSFCDEMYL